MNPLEKMVYSTQKKKKKKKQKHLQIIDRSHCGKSIVADSNCRELQRKNKKGHKEGWFADKNRGLCFVLMF